MNQRWQSMKLKNMNRATKGFTLLELMLTLAVAVILITVAVPAFKDAIMSNRRDTQVSDFILSLSLARSEAIKRAQQVTLCKSSNGSTCSTNDSVNWENGWIVFVDLNANGTYSTTSPVEIILSVHGTLPGDLKLRDPSADSNFADWIAYQPSGVSKGKVRSNGTFVICDSRGKAYGRKIVIGSTGRASSASLDNDDSCP